MKPAGMGRGNGVWHSEKSRGDSILWITDGLRGSGELPEVTWYYSVCLAHSPVLFYSVL